ncbi:MAG: hypothetical protein FJ255_10455 [Phycisphaerae bacterium]|nr:hypothetical protein [Phycisphaerae bacterium]
MQYQTMAALIVACGLAAAPAALARQEVRVGVTMASGEGGPGGGGNTISRRGVDKYAAALEMTSEQKEAAVALHEGYQAAVGEVQRAFAESIAEMRRSFEESQDPSVFGEKMPKARGEQRAKLAALEKSLLADLRAILTPDQAQRWSKVERLRRRETHLRGMLSGESVDLTEVIAGLRLGETDATLRDALEDYEHDLDRALKGKEAIAGGGEAALGGGQFDIEAMRKAMNEQREAGLKVKEVNERHARKLREMLPETARERFAQAVRRESFPMVYRPSRVSRTLEAAEKLEGVTTEQRQRLREVREQYEREAGPLNDRWASAIEEAEKEGAEGGVMLGDGGMMRMSFGPEQSDTPRAIARRARRELDDRFRQQVEKVLTPEQIKQLPPPAEQVMEGGPDGAIRVIRGGGG